MSVEKLWGVGRRVLVPFWLIALPVVASSAAAFVVDRRIKGRARINLCPKCNYDRAGIAGDAKCPECGAMPSSKITI
jgi:hypothetical protein